MSGKSTQIIWYVESANKMSNISYCSDSRLSEHCTFLTRKNKITQICLVLNQCCWKAPVDVSVAFLLNVVGRYGPYSYCKRWQYHLSFQAANTIRTLEGLDRLEHLTKLHLRDNQIEKLDGFSENMKTLQYINLR